MATELALVVRAAGVRAHLLTRPALDALAAAPDPGALARALRAHGPDVDPIPDPPDAIAIDRAAGATTARHLRTLARWDGSRPGALDVFAADEDRRALRALLRGATQGAPAGERLAGLVPTRTLPARALDALARLPSPAAVAAELVLLGHPDAARLRPLVREARPDLLVLDVALLAGFVARAAAAVRRDPVLATFVASLVDAVNAANALLIAAGGGRASVDPAPLFAAGGRWLRREAFVAVAGASSIDAAASAVRVALAGTPLGGLVPVGAADPGDLHGRFLSLTAHRLTREARRDPLGTAALLGTLVRLAIQRRDLRTLAWGAALGVPPALRRRALVTS
ncbi:MAG: V-type ATPase subunit [Vicinamibacterales bacterium]